MIGAVSGGTMRWLTLVTGDRVRVERVGADVLVRDAVGGQGRAGMVFRRESEGGDEFVVPADAAPLVASGRVDRRLFDVSALARSGETDDMRVIVRYEGRSARAEATAAGGEVTRSLPALSGDALRVPQARAGALWNALVGTGQRGLSAGVGRVWLDARASVRLDRTAAQIGAPVAWAAGMRGAGVTVAVLDTGVDADHPDLDVAAARDFTGGAAGTSDENGHGTHVAGIITGDGTASRGKYVGIASEARLLSGKVLDKWGAGNESDIIAGMQWAVDEGADVVNMSLGSDQPDDGTAPLSVAVDELSRSSGALFVVAAGNRGPRTGTIGSPGSATTALTVGAVDRDNAIASFSSRGPRLGDSVIKPDITAPGLGVVSALAHDSVFAHDLPAVDGRYVSVSGTSMAAPHVAGAAALLAGRHPKWRGEQVKSALMGSAAPTTGASIYEQGAGRVDLARASTQAVFATPASVGHGVVEWPHDDDQPIETALTYHNDGEVAVTLDLAADVWGPGGASAPAGMFTLEPARLVVPAGGTAESRLVTSMLVDGPDGFYSGAVVAVGGGTSVRTPVAVTREVESYDVALSVLDRTGLETSEHFVRFVGVDNSHVVISGGSLGQGSVRVPKGTYSLDADILTANDASPWGGELSVIVEPTMTLGGDATLVLDAREAKPIGFVTDRADARNGVGWVSVRRRAGQGRGMGLEMLGPLEGLFFRPSRTVAPDTDFYMEIGGRYARDDGHGGFTGSPYLYNFSRSVHGGVPSMLQKRVRDRELASRRTELAAAGPGEVAMVESLVPVPTPGHLIEYFTPGAEWQTHVEIAPAEDPTTLLAFQYREGDIFRRGLNRTHRWNEAVFAPSLRAADDTNPTTATVQRTGDTIKLFAPTLFTSPTAHGGISFPETDIATLWRDGVQVGESQPARNFRVTVPPGRASYRVGVTATREVPNLSTRVSVAWTFGSDTTPTDRVTALPVRVVRFAPPLNHHNQAPAGKEFRIPFTVDKQTANGYGTPSAPTVEASYDDGKTWTPAAVTGAGERGTATVRHPTGSRHVSLKATATDTAGNTVELTVIRAYSIG
ncbi:S8 family serine peptidase [Micromonospora sp. NPDC005324]|uniref:S8 family serine peptidase n=1 Tax=Micromonospora sp. NPDC005324 TaxID=3157033 RepID=UPI0033BF0723